MTLSDALFMNATKYRVPIIRLFQICYALLAIIWFMGDIAIYTNSPVAPQYFSLGIEFGEVAIIFFSILLVPGIAKRFGLKHKLLSILKIFRRHLGITMYTLVIVHSSFELLVFVIAGRVPLLPQPLYVLLGMCASAMLFLLFVTSNDWSVNTFGIWWYRLHWLVHPVLGLIFFHVALQDPKSIWAILLFCVILLQGASFAYSWLHKAPKLPPTQPNTPLP